MVHMLCSLRHPGCSAQQSEDPHFFFNGNIKQHLAEEIHTSLHGLPAAFLLIYGM